MIIDFSNIGGGGGYVLPVASTEVLGGVKIGSGVTVDSGGTISVDVPEVEQDYKIVSAITDYKVGNMFAIVTNTGSTSFDGNPQYTEACGKNVYIKGQIADTSLKYVFNPYLGIAGYGGNTYIDLFLQKEVSDEYPTLMVKYGNATVINETFTGNSINVSLPEVTGKYSIFGGVALTAALEEDNYVSLQLQGDGLKNCVIRTTLCNYNINIQNVYTEVEQIEKLDSLEYMEDNVWSNNIYMIEGNQYIERMTGSDNMHKKLRVAGMAAKTNFNDSLNVGDVMAYKYQMGWMYDDNTSTFTNNYDLSKTGWWIDIKDNIHVAMSGETQINLRLIVHENSVGVWLYRNSNPDDRVEECNVDNYEMPCTKEFNNYDLKFDISRSTETAYNQVVFSNFRRKTDDETVVFDVSEAIITASTESSLYKKTDSGWTEIGNVPVATNSVVGGVKVSGWDGLYMDNNEIKIQSLPSRPYVDNSHIGNVTWNSIGNIINSGSAANTNIIDLTYVPLDLLNRDFWCGSFYYNGSDYNVRLNQINPTSLQYKVMDDSWATIFTATTSGDGVYNVAASEPYEATITVSGNIVTIVLTNSDINDIRLWYENMSVLVTNIDNKLFPLPVRPKLGAGLKYNSNGEIVLA